MVPIYILLAGLAQFTARKKQTKHRKNQNIRSRKDGKEIASHKTNKKKNIV